MNKTSILRGTKLDIVQTEPCHASGAKPTVIGFLGWESVPMAMYLRSREPFIYMVPSKRRKDLKYKQ